MTKKTIEHITPPANASRIWRVSDLPKARASQAYRITNSDGSEAKITLSKRRRQVLDLLLKGPVYCASPVRLSDMVHVLKRENGLEVHTEFYPGDKETGTGTYGVYFLKSHVVTLSAREAA
jgi:hypothetical protein